MKSLKYLAVLTGLFALSTHNPALAESKNRIIQFQTEVSQKVENDEMQATLYTELTNKNADVLAKEINQIINKNINIVKKYPQIQIRTGNQHTYPVYNDKNQISHWRSRTEISLSSSDFKVTSEVIAKLQQDLKLSNISFNVSKAQRERIEQQLYLDVSQKFQSRAEALLKVWNAQRYELVNLQLSDSENRFHAPVAMMASASMRKSADIEPQNYEAGESEVSVTATGSIQLF